MVGELAGEGSVAEDVGIMCVCFLLLIKLNIVKLVNRSTIIAAGRRPTACGES